MGAPIGRAGERRAAGDGRAAPRRPPLPDRAADRAGQVELPSSAAGLPHVPAGPFTCVAFPGLKRRYSRVRTATAGYIMANNFVRSLARRQRPRLDPAATGAFAAADGDTVREFDEFMTVFNRVRSEYVEQVDDKTLIRGAIDGMLASLDPHSSYLDERGYQSLMTTTDGEYGGLGLNVTMEDGAVKVIAPTEDTPGDKAGIKAGDYHHPSQRQADLRRHARRGGRPDARRARHLDQAHHRPARPRQAVRRHHHPRDHPARRGEVGGARTASASSTSTASAATRPTRRWRRSPASSSRSAAPPLGYIVDLRSNPGGLLDQAVGLSDVFLERGEVVSQRGRKKSDIERYYAAAGRRRARPADHRAGRFRHRLGRRDRRRARCRTITARS